MDNSLIEKLNKAGIEHPTVKPVDLLIYLVQLMTNENEVVIDPFMGSGTTCIACYKQNRYYIGVEIDKKYFDIACSRIDELEKSPELF